MKRDLLLAVDDKQDSLDVLQSLIAQYLPGCELLTAASADEGLAAAAESDPDGLLIDLHMPGMDGIEMCRRLKSDEKTAHVPVILISANHPDPKLKAEGLEAGADGFLIKPIDNIELVARIKVMLRIKHAQDEFRATNATLEQQVAERTRALRESEGLCEAIAEDTPVMICRFLPSGKITYANEACCKYFGTTSEEFVGSSFLSLIPEEDRETVMVNISAMTIESSIQTHEQRVIAAGGEIRWQRRTNRALFDAKGQPVAYQSIGGDITDRKRAEEALRASNRALTVLSECNQALVRATDESDLLHSTCQILVEKGGYRLAWVGYAEQDDAKSVRPVAQMGYDEGYLDMLNITWADTQRGRGPTGTAIRTGRPVLARNILTNPEFVPWRRAALDHGYASSIALPLISGERAFGALNVYSLVSDAFDEEEERLLVELGNDVAYGIMALRTREEHKRAEEELEKHREHLEGLVRERTAELARLSAEQRLILDSVRATIWYKDTENRILRVNRAAAESVGLRVEEIEGKSIFDLFPKEADRYIEDDLEVIRSGMPKLGIVEPARSASGEKRWVLTDKVPHCDAAGNVTGVIACAIDITERKKAEEDMEKRSAELRTIVKAMAGRENRMVGLKKAVKKLRAQLEEVGMTPVADDPLMSGSNLDAGHASMRVEDETSR